LISTNAEIALGGNIIGFEKRFHALGHITIRGRFTFKTNARQHDFCPLRNITGETHSEAAGHSAHGNLSQPTRQTALALARSRERDPLDDVEFDRFPDDVAVKMNVAVVGAIARGDLRGCPIAWNHADRVGNVFWDGYAEQTQAITRADARLPNSHRTLRLSTGITVGMEGNREEKYYFPRRTPITWGFSFLTRSSVLNRRLQFGHSRRRQMWLGRGRESITSVLQPHLAQWDGITLPPPSPSFPL
jgi:hypothetical protein